ncbi:hypothetical protein MMC07_004610 [Pseudocyphellaria aurata]|nr:hypothetical protein [Pseudocyphellaria aurata]
MSTDRSQNVGASGFGDMSTKDLYAALWSGPMEPDRWDCASAKSAGGGWKTAPSKPKKTEMARMTSRKPPEGVVAAGPARSPGKSTPEGVVAAGPARSPGPGSPPAKTKRPHHRHGRLSRAYRGYIPDVASESGRDLRGGCGQNHRFTAPQEASRDS